MSISVNRAIICGRVGKDPELRAGGDIVAFSVATSRSWRDKSTGERREVTQWHKVSILADVPAKFAREYVRKGDLVYVEGAIESRKWDKDGEEQWITEIVVRPYDGSIQLQSKSGARQPGEGDGEEESGEPQKPAGDSATGARSTAPRAGARPGAVRGGASTAFSSNVSDDDIPFAPEWR